MYKIFRLLNDHETKYNQWKDAESRLELKIEGLQSLITEQKQRVIIYGFLNFLL